jgi:hypothetical protein
MHLQDRLDLQDLGVQGSGQMAQQQQQQQQQQLAS